MKNNSLRLIKYINIYLQIAKYILPAGIILGFVGMISSLLSHGMYNQSRFSVMGIKLIETPKKTAFSPFVDGIIITVIGIIIAAILIIIIFKFSRFIMNIRENNFLAEENGKLLKQNGLLIATFSIILMLQEIVLNLGSLVNKIPTWYEIMFMLLIMPLLYVIMHPIFLLGMFFVLFGEIMLKASELKQENDLTV